MQNFDHSTTLTKTGTRREILERERRLKFTVSGQRLPKEGSFHVFRRHHLSILSSLGKMQRSIESSFSKKAVSTCSHNMLSVPTNNRTKN